MRGHACSTRRANVSTYSLLTHLSDATVRAKSEMRFAGEKRLVDAVTHSLQVIGDRFMVSAFRDLRVAS